MSKKTDFEIFSDMIAAGEDFSMSPNFVSANLVKAGGHVTMGVDAGTIHKLLNDEVQCVMYVFNKKQFFGRKNSKE